MSSIPKKVTVDLAGEPAPIALPIEGKCQDTDCIDPSPDKSINGYYTSWAQYARKYNAVDIPVRTLNQVTYAFIGYDKSGNIHLLDPYSDGKQLLALATLRQQYPYLNVCLSFGGWSLSNDFSALSANEAALDNFVNNVIAAVKQLGANGIDIDWEYPVVKSGNPADASNFAKMLTKLRAGLDSLSEQKTILSIAAPGGVDKIQAIQKADPTAWTQIAASVDQLNIMSYDYHGAWDQYSAPMSALRSDPRSPYAANPVVNKYDVVDTVNAYKALGVFRSEQMNIGFPAYGRLVNINEIGDRFGLWQEITGTPPGEYDATGVFDYRCIKASECHGLRKLPADIRFVNPEDTTYGSYSQTPWAYGPQSLTYLSFDDAASVERKAEYVKKNGLGGMMCWDLSGDLAATNQDSLIATVHNAFSSQQNARAMLASKTDSVIDSGDFSETQTSAAARLESPLTTLFAISLSSTTNCRNTDSTLTYFVLVKNAFSETYAWLHQQFSAYTTQRPEPKMPWLDRGAETSTAEQPCRYFDGSTNVITDYGIDSMGIKHRLASGSVEPNTALIPQCQQTKPWITQDSINTLGTMFYSGLLGLLYGAANKGLELAISSRLDIAPKKTKNIIWGINLTVMAYGIYQGANVFAVLMPLAVNNTVRWGATRLGASQYLSIGLSVLASAGVGYWQSDSELFLWSWAVSHLCYFVGEQLVSWAANRPEKTDTTAASRQGLFAQVRYDADAVEPESTRGNTLPFFQRPFFCF